MGGEPRGRSDEESSTNANISNSNEGRQNAVEGSQIEGSVEMSYVIKQSNDKTSVEVPISDPSNLNGRVAFYETLVKLLPLPNDQIDTVFGGSGIVGLLVTIAYFGNLFPQYSGVIPVDIPPTVGVMGFLLLGLTIGYMTSQEDSQCPECDASFGLETTETVKFPELSDDEYVRGRLTRECKYCDYSMTEEAVEWPKEKFEKDKF